MKTDNRDKRLVKDALVLLNKKGSFSLLALNIKATTGNLNDTSAQYLLTKRQIWLCSVDIKQLPAVNKSRITIYFKVHPL